MSFFNTTAKLEHRTLLPPKAKFEQAISLLRNHDYLIRLDPELAKYNHMTPPPDANPKTKFYSITDQCVFSDHHFFYIEFRLVNRPLRYIFGSSPSGKRPEMSMEALPLGLWGTTVNFEAEMTDVETGIEWIIRAPMGLVQTSHWIIEPAGPEDGVGEEKGKRLVLVERVLISANVFLVKTVKSKCIENYKGIHQKFADKLAEGALSAKVADVTEPVIT